jgi:hypothetical protein
LNAKGKYFAMKNRYQEHLKKSAKRYHRNARNANFSKGLIQFHLYEPEMIHLVLVR